MEENSGMFPENTRQKLKDFKKAHVNHYFGPFPGFKNESYKEEAEDFELKNACLEI